MTLFELVKQNICVPDAAKHYGLQVNRNGMCSCPFHEDRHPSLQRTFGIRQKSAAACFPRKRRSLLSMCSDIGSWRQRLRL